VSLEARRLRLGTGVELTLGRAPGPILVLVEAGTLRLAAEQRIGAVVLQPGLYQFGVMVAQTERPLLRC